MARYRSPAPQRLHRRRDRAKNLQTFGMTLCDSLRSKPRFARRRASRRASCQGFEFCIRKMAHFKGHGRVTRQATSRQPDVDGTQIAWRIQKADWETMMTGGGKFFSSLILAAIGASLIGPQNVDAAAKVNFITNLVYNGL